MNLSRRTFLTSAGVSLALPCLDAIATPKRGMKSKPRRRMVCICTPLGLHTPFLFPEKTGKDYVSTPYLDVIKDYRDDFTVISGLTHPGVEMGHDSIFSYLTAVPHPERRAGFRNQISLDQFAAEKIGGETRFSTLSLSHEGFGLSWTRSGALVPPDTSPAAVFRRLFLKGRPEEVRAQVKRLRDNRSILDKVGGQAATLRTGLGANDREKLDEYFSSVRDLEKRMVRAEEWSKQPKPKVDAKPPQDIRNPADLLGKTRLMFDMTHLALLTDSTRLVSILLGGISLVPLVPGVSLGHHNLSHHGKDPNKIAQLKKVELATMSVFRDLLKKLKQTKEEGDTLLDRTMLFFSSNLGSGSSHSCKNLPTIFAGGGFQHGRHLAFNPAKTPPLCNLYVTMLQRLGLECDQFGSSTGTLTGLQA